MNRKTSLQLLIIIGLSLTLFSDCEDEPLGTCTITCHCHYGGFTQTQTDTFKDVTEDQCHDVMIDDDLCPSSCIFTFVENKE
jgi:hypothetical protein